MTVKNTETMRHLYVALLCLLLAACSRPAGMPLTVSGNAVYYWRTVFSLSAAEQAFLSSHHIGRVYCRYFDVVNDGERGPMPHATIAFSGPLPQHVRLVPTVFIMNDCMTHCPDSLARLIVNRIVQMNETNDVEGVDEIQMDCDYSLRTRAAYYRFLGQLRSEARRHGFSLSVTIRLHQLSMPAPPADYGVLMLYNTGLPERFAERNPILDMRDVTPYLRHLKDYPLPLAAAYPVFQWQRTIHGVQIAHEAPFSEVMLTKKAVEKERDDLRQLIIAYHLSEENIDRYTTTEYEAIYRH